MSESGNVAHEVSPNFTKEEESQPGREDSGKKSKSTTKMMKSFLTAGLSRASKISKSRKTQEEKSDAAPEAKARSVQGESGEDEQPKDEQPQSATGMMKSLLVAGLSQASKASEPGKVQEEKSDSAPETGPELTPEAEEGSKGEVQTTTGMMKSLLQEGLTKANEELLPKGKLMLSKSLGLGRTPSVIPPADPDFNCTRRSIRLGWHPVAGLAGKWFAEETGLGMMITEKINKYPDPTQHWGILVENYCHELWMDEHLDVIYQNKKIDQDEWTTFEVGTTTFNDEALRQAGEMVIFNMREKQAAYNLISNNCQNFAVMLLEAIQKGSRSTRNKFATSFAIYEKAIGLESITDLFPKRPGQKEEGKEEEEEEEGEPEKVVQHAQQVMEENTTAMDSQRSFF